MSEQAYREQLEKLLPSGRAWPRQNGTTMSALLSGFGAELSRVDDRAQDLLRESDPRTTLELLPEWERALGLPDTCTGPLVDVAARRGALVARLVQSGGQSPAFFAQIALALGFVVTIQEYRPFGAGSLAGEPLTNPGQPFQVGISGAGDALDNRLDWLFAWTVRASDFTVRRAMIGSFGAGDPLATWGNTLLECTLSRLAPAHTTVRFLYSTTLQPDEVQALAVALDPEPLFFIGPDEDA